MRVFYLPASSLDLSSESLRESMRRWHWRRYFQCLRHESGARRRTAWSDFAPEAAAIYRKQADYHRKLAQSLEKTR